MSLDQWRTLSLIQVDAFTNAAAIHRLQRQQDIAIAVTSGFSTKPGLLISQLTQAIHAHRVGDADRIKDSVMDAELDRVFGRPVGPLSDSGLLNLGFDRKEE